MELLIKRRNYFLGLGIIPSILFLAIVFFALSWSQDVHKNNAMQSLLNDSYRMFYAELYEEAKLIDALAYQFSNDSEMLDAYMKKDRERLLEIAQPVFQKINTNHDITHCYFLSPDGGVFLRVHHPSLYGDQIDRQTFRQAQLTGTISYGMELGTMGTLTLRVVIPWRVDDELVGYLELGKEIDNAVHEMNKMLDMDLIVVVNKAYLDREQVELNDDASSIGSWDEFPEVVVFAKTVNTIPAILHEDLAKDHYEHENLILQYTMDNSHYLAGFAPLFDVSERDIGDIVIIKDFTETEMIEKRLTQIMLDGYISCVLLYLLFVYVMVNSMKKKLVRAQKKPGSDSE